MQQMLYARRQTGVTMLTALVMLAIAVFFVMIGLKMVPVYIENYSVKQILATMEEDRAMRSMSPGDIRQAFMKRLQINSVYDFDRDSITIKKEKEGTLFAVDYEVRKPVMGNVSVVMQFSESALIPLP